MTSLTRISNWKEDRRFEGVFFLGRWGRGCFDKVGYSFSGFGLRNLFHAKKRIENSVRVEVMGMLNWLVRRCGWMGFWKRKV